MADEVVTGHMRPDPLDAPPARPHSPTGRPSGDAVPSVTRRGSAVTRKDSMIRQVFVAIVVASSVLNAQQPPAAPGMEWRQCAVEAPPPPPPPPPIVPIFVPADSNL